MSYMEHERHQLVLRLKRKSGNLVFKLLNAHEGIMGQVAWRRQVLRWSHPGEACGVTSPNAL